MIPALLVTTLAFLLSVLLTPVVRRLAILAGITDAPGPRRIHLRVIPRSGGLAVGTAVAIACGVVGGMPAHIGALAVAGAALLLVVGFADDVLSLPPKLKLLGQVAAAGLAVASGLRLELVAPAGAVGLVAMADAALTLAWIVFITNAVNLTDGLDGLASGIGVIACALLAATALRGGDVASAMVPLAFAGALLGFLVYNFNPASIFLGDTGSLIIGYAMAVLPLMGDGGHALPTLAAFLLVAVPVTDTLLAIARRFLSRCIAGWAAGRFWFGLADGLRNTLSPDRRHVHHRLLDLGLTQRRAVLMLYLAGGTTGALGFLVSASPGWPVDLFAVGFAVAVIAVVESLGFDELKPVRSGLLLPLLRRLATHRVLLKIADAVVVMGMYAAALWVNGRLATFGLDTAIALILMVALQLAAFAVLGVYRAAWGMSGVSGVGLLLRACAAGTVTGYVVLRLLDLPVGGAAAIVHFSLVLSAVTVIRLSYVLLLHAAQRALPAEPTLICGTAAGARHALAHLRQAGVGNLKPIGLIAQRPRLQGRQVDQLPVLGTLEFLPAIVREHGAVHVVIADSNLRGERAAWVRAVCRQLGVRVHRYMEKFVSYDDTLSGSADLGAASDILEELFDGAGLAGVAQIDGAEVPAPSAVATPNGTDDDSQRRSDKWN
jgi:UDP-GlcNAc:undecaprenyl-phosphate GlcNAc-1-phosphate transferase